MSAASDDPALAPRLPDTLRLGPAHLTVSHLDGSIAFYQRALGLQLHGHDGEVATMGTGGEDLLVLVEDTDAGPGGRHAGLFHFALLVAGRTELARAVLRLASTQTRIEGTADHGVSESVYLRDPDDNGIELYADRPRALWPPARHPDERVEIFTVALNMKDLMREVEGEEPREHAGEGVVMGHLHLHVGDVGRGLAFYRDVLGFEIMVLLPSAAFVSAGGYHHHLGFNVWLGPDVKPPPPHTAGLRHWTVQLRSADEVAAVRMRADDAGLETLDHGAGFLVRDPWETAVVFSVG